MGCQCAYQKDEDLNLNDELINKNSIEEVNEGEQDQDNNNYEQKEGIFGLTNDDGTEQAQFRVFNGENNNNMNNMEEEQEQEQEQEHEQEHEQDNLYKEKINEDKNVKYADYPEKMLELINKIREDPVNYAEIIEDSIKNIIEVQNEEDENKPRIIYKNKVKVALTRGEPAFREAADILRNMSSLPPLELKNDICVPLPETEKEIRDSSYLKEQIKILRDHVNIDVFFKDLIKIPEVSALLMIVDDSGKNPGRKRNSVLNKDFKYIGINSKFIGKTFIAYFTFSSE